MRTLILGAGATGGYFGARMIEGGADVSFLVRPGRAEQLRKNGLVVKSMFGDLHLSHLQIIETVIDIYDKSILSPRASELFDLIILSCKAYDLPSAIDSIRPVVGGNTTILPILNGMRHIDELQEQFGAEKVIGGLCVISSKLDDEGNIVHFNDTHGFKFGELSGEMTPRIKQIETIMQPTKIAWRASEHVQEDMWEKWTMLSTLAGLTCMMRATIGQISRSPDGTHIAEQLFDECLCIMGANGYTPRSEFIDSVRARSVDPKSTLTASMLRDIERGGKVEGDHILGDLIARAEAKNISVPMLKIAYCHVKSYETRKLDGG